MTCQVDAGSFTEKLTFAAKRAAMAVAEVVEKNHTGIVAIELVLGPWISQTHNRFNGVAWHSVNWLVLLA
tara:strand:- start:615 stop:824 length:210 start_codon:yes stop_codon:yes gene_type:complete